MGASGHVQVHATQIERTLECTLSRSPTGSPAAAACPHVARRQNRSTDTGPILGPIVSSITPLFFSFSFFFMLALGFPKMSRQKFVFLFAVKLYRGKMYQLISRKRLGLGDFVRTLNSGIALTLLRILFCSNYPLILFFKTILLIKVITSIYF